MSELLCLNNRTNCAITCAKCWLPKLLLWCVSVRFQWTRHYHWTRQDSLYVGQFTFEPFPVASHWRSELWQRTGCLVSGWVDECDWMYVCVCAHARTCMCVCMHKRETDRQTDRETDRERQRQTHRDRERGGGGGGGGGGGEREGERKVLIHTSISSWAFDSVSNYLFQSITNFEEERGGGGGGGGGQKQTDYSSPGFTRQVCA